MEDITEMFKQLVDAATRDKALLLLSDVLSKLTVGDLKRRDVNKLNRALLDEVNRLAERKQKEKVSRKPKLKVLTPSSTILDYEMGRMAPCAVLKLSPRVARVVKLTGISTMRDFVQKTGEDLCRTKGIAARTVEMISKVLARYELRLGMTPDEVERIFGPDPRLAKPVNFDALRANADKGLELLDLTVRAHNRLEELKIKTIRQLISAHEIELCPSTCGRATFEELQTKLEPYGLRLWMPADEIERLIGPQQS